ncbi:Plasmid stability protein-like protein [Alloalcanivorax dieselolei B5]|uniref:Plasmid stability protein-like protein n=1 Tax=Alcanivorax dieselolei (strain DSM 16502 / CGMCC 1.3690 / MCCC 1A00001 / B-5) TaxID=930169 RepID=K0CBU8_ALCDB|nr:plasmid stabilization protein [Alloalcanivorax dieselolei]AFT69950.1 Plasmid stability protein-like protein [Alloalcanivorax dieselolei B5]GGJ88117.1 plasmid stabilization protein [Alloalcanivorax dieselolei]
MASITIRNLDDELKARLRLSAAEHGHSMEEEVRQILHRALEPGSDTGLGTRIRERFAAYDAEPPEFERRRDAPRDPGLDQ